MEINKMTGKVMEEELEVLAGQEVVGGLTPTTPAALIGAGGIIVGALIVATYSAGFCPTSACTGSCNR